MRTARRALTDALESATVHRFLFARKAPLVPIASDDGLYLYTERMFLGRKKLSKIFQGLQAHSMHSLCHPIRTVHECVCGFHSPACATIHARVSPQELPCSTPLMSPCCVAAGWSQHLEAGPILQQEARPFGGTQTHLPEVARACQTRSCDVAVASPVGQMEAARLRMLMAHCPAQLRTARLKPCAWLSRQDWSVLYPWFTRVVRQS